MASDNLVNAYERLYRSILTAKNVDTAWQQMNLEQVNAFPGWTESERLRRTADYMDASDSAQREIFKTLDEIAAINAQNS